GTSGTVCSFSARLYEVNGADIGRRLFAWIERLPQFDLVAIGGVNPHEGTVTFILAFWIDVDAFFRQALEQCVQVVDDVVHHERGWAGLEVSRVAREDAPDCHLLIFR